MVRVAGLGDCGLLEDDAAAAAEAQRREENRLNELKQWEAHDRHRDQIRHLEKRITLLQEELWAMRQREAAREQQDAPPKRRQGWLW